MDTATAERIDKLLSGETIKRNTVFGLIPEGAERILDIGYGHGTLLLHLLRHKGCRKLYGIDMRRKKHMDEFLEQNWNLELTLENVDLGEEYHGFFDWIVMHDFLEHIHEPWYLLWKVNHYLSERGKAVIVVPNSQYWEFAYALLSGDYPYGTPGMWNEEHIRLYTYKSLCEVALLSGLKVDRACLLFHQAIAPSMPGLEALMARDEVTELEFPPLEFSSAPFAERSLLAPHNHRHGERFTVRFPRDVRSSAPFFMANKLLLVCSSSGLEVEPVISRKRNLPKLRKAFAERVPPSKMAGLLPGGVEMLVSQDSTHTATIS